MAPVQVVIIPVAEEYKEYANKLKDELYQDYVRVEVDDSNETLNKKIRNSITNMKIPNVLILGEKERESESVTLRQYGVKQQKFMSITEFKSWLNDEITNRNLPKRDIG